MRFACDWPCRYALLCNRLYISFVQRALSSSPRTLTACIRADGVMIVPDPRFKPIRSDQPHSPVLRVGVMLVPSSHRAQRHSVLTSSLHNNEQIPTIHLN